MHIDRRQFVGASGALALGAILTTTYSVSPSGDSAGAQFMAGLVTLASWLSSLAARQSAAPSGAMRTKPLERPAGLPALAMNPKERLPATSTVRGVLMRI